MRLHQFLSKSGEFKLKEDAILAIIKGEIRIGNRVIINQNYFFNEKKERVYYKDKILNIKPKILLAINKPRGILCSKLTMQDKNLNKKSIYELIPPKYLHLSCIGRLDEDSEGLLFMTNDGDFLHKIISKETNVLKKYYVELKEDITKKKCEQLENGVEIELEENRHKTKYKTQTCQVKQLDNNKIEIILFEGKKRQIRKMIDTINNKVNLLRRIQIGNYKLLDSNLNYGDFLDITDYKTKI
ncbi:MAG: pseudouridine synthase [Candidatus Woesearchaeota archaeon]